MKAMLQGTAGAETIETLSARLRNRTETRMVDHHG